MHFNFWEKYIFTMIQNHPLGLSGLRSEMKGIHAG
jgi:hypothetical protein